MPGPANDNIVSTFRGFLLVLPMAQITLLLVLVPCCHIVLASLLVTPCYCALALILMLVMRVQAIGMLGIV
jgi:hypothetical protein